MSKPKPVRLVKDGKVTEAVKPTTVTNLKAKGWKVEKPAAPKSEVGNSTGPHLSFGDDKKGDA